MCKFSSVGVRIALGCMLVGLSQSPTHASQDESITTEKPGIQTFTSIAQELANLIKESESTNTNTGTEHLSLRAGAHMNPERFLSQQSFELPSNVIRPIARRPGQIRQD